MKIIIRLLFLSIALLVIHEIKAQGFLHTNNKLIVNGIGHEVQLRGMGLGGWMVQEGYMLKINKNGTQHEIKNRIRELIGETECNQFYNDWLRNHTRKSDIDSLARWGFNSIRLPMHYNLFTLPIEEEPIKGGNTWLSKGFELTDSLLSWCKSNNMYLFLDLHAAPGGQGKDANISDYNPSKPGLWESELNKEKTIALWRKLASRYANEPFIGGYDLINEPNWTWEGKNPNGTMDTSNAEIWSLYKKITSAIREVDKNHIVIVEGNGWGGNYGGFPPIWDDNMVISFHKYWNPNTQESIAKFIKMRESFQVPIWLGESGENSNQWFTECIRLMEKNHIGWAWWPLKKVDSYVCPLHVVMPDEYKLILNYWNEAGPKPTLDVSLKAFRKLTDNLKSNNCFFVKDYVDAMFRQVSDSSAIPYKKHVLPCKISAVDFDLGSAGKAYFNPIDTRRIKSGNSVNFEAIYRNDRVKIGSQTSSTDPAHKQFFLKSGLKDQWFSYTLENPKSGKFDLYATVGSEKEASLIYFYMDQDDKHPLVAKVERAIGGFKKIKVGNAYLNSGNHKMKVVIASGSPVIMDIEFVKK